MHTCMIAQLPSFNKNKQKKKKNDPKEKENSKIPHQTKKQASSLGNYQKLTYLAVQMKITLTQYK